MALRNMFGQELLDEYKSGKRVFSDIQLQFAELSGTNLPDIIIKDSKIHFTLFRVSNLTNCKFINCEIFFGGFRQANLTNAAFERCKIDYGYFDRATFDNTKMIKCSLSWCGMFSTNTGSLDMSSSTLFKVFTDVSQITQGDVDAAYAGLVPFMQNLDFQIKHQMEELLKSTMNRVGKKPTIHPGNSSAYEKTEQLASGYKSLEQLVENLILGYAAKNPYKSKAQYERPNPYKR